MDYVQKKENKEKDYVSMIMKGQLFVLLLLRGYTEAILNIIKTNIVYVREIEARPF